MIWVRQSKDSMEILGKETGWWTAGLQCDDHQCYKKDENFFHHPGVVADLWPQQLEVNRGIFSLSDSQSSSRQTLCPPHKPRWDRQWMWPSYWISSRKFWGLLQLISRGIMSGLGLWFWHAMFLGFAELELDSVASPEFTFYFSQLKFEWLWANYLTTSSLRPSFVK